MEVPLPSTIVFVLTCLGEFLFGSVYGSEIFDRNRKKVPFFSFDKASEWGPLKRKSESDQSRNIDNTAELLEQYGPQTRNFLKYGKLERSLRWPHDTSIQYYFIKKSYGIDDFESEGELCYDNVDRGDVAWIMHEVEPVMDLKDDPEKVRLFFICDGHCCGLYCCQLNLMFFVLLGAVIAIVFLIILAVLFVKKFVWGRLREKMRKRESRRREDGTEGMDDNDNDPYQKEWVSVFSPRFQVDSDSKMEFKAPPPPGRASRVVRDPLL